METNKAILQEMLDELHWDMAPRRLYEPMQYMLARGGKRLRPHLVLLAARMYGKDEREALPVAKAVELFHNFTLMHDDIMDGAELRRGRPTVHKAYDTDTAILSGDMMLIAAYHELQKLNKTALKRVLQVFNETARRVCEGQRYDLDFETRADLRVANYLHMIELKTATLFGGALKMGALVEYTHVREVEELYEVGLNLGMAFQLQDDILDVFGDHQQTGKAVGGDIRKNKKTFLLLKAWALAGPKLKERLQNCMNGNTPVSEKVDTVVHIYKKLDVRTHAEKLQAQYARQAVNYLDNLQVLESARKPLRELIEQLLSRKK